MSEPRRDPNATSLSIGAARTLTTETKSAPQMAGITPRWLLRVLPWVPVSGGVYRVNRRLRHALGDGTIRFTQVGSAMRVIPQELRELPFFAGFEDTDVLEALADRFVQADYAAGDAIVHAGQPSDRLLLLARGKVSRWRAGPYGDRLELGMLADGGHFGDRALVEPAGAWDFTARAETACTVLSLTYDSFRQALAHSESLRVHLAGVAARLAKPQDKDGQAAIGLAAGHRGEPSLPGTFVDYDPEPREYELGVVQTVLQVHSRVADLYNGPFDQTREQLRLVIEALREREEYELLNNAEFGLLHGVDAKQRLTTRSGPPTPDDMDELLCRRRKTQYFLAQPRAIAAFGRECNRRGVYPEVVEVGGQRMQAWRGVPILPCTKIPITGAQTTTILAMRTGAENQGVVGLRPESLPEEVEPGLNVRFMGITGQAVMRYLVSAYHGAAVLVPDALGVLEHVAL